MKAFGKLFMKLMRKILYILIFIISCQSFVLGQEITLSSPQVVLASSLLKQGKFDEAITLLDKALESDKKNVGAFYLRGTAKMLTRNFSQAIPDFDKVIELAPDASGIEQVYNNRGQMHYFFGSFEKALADFNRSISINPKYAPPYGGRANILSAKGDLDKALADYDKAVELDPRSVVGFVGQAAVYFEKGEMDKALIAVDKSLELDPGNPSSLLRRGMTLGLKGYWDLAAENINMGLKMNAESQSIYYGNINISLSDLDKFVAANNKNARAYAVRGLIKLLQKKESESIEDFKKAFELDNKLKTEMVEHIAPIKDKLND